MFGGPDDFVWSLDSEGRLAAKSDVSDLAQYDVRGHVATTVQTGHSGGAPIAPLVVT